MAKRKRHYKRHGIPLLLIVGMITVGIFFWIYGWSMTLRYMLGALMFATFTTFMVRWLNSRYGRKMVRL